MRGARITEKRWVGGAIVKNHRIVSDLGNKRSVVIAHNESRKHDEWIDRGDQKAPLFQIMEATLGEIDPGIDLLNAGLLQAGLLQFLPQLVEARLLDCEKGVFTFALLRPAVARLGKKKTRMTHRPRHSCRHQIRRCSHPYQR